MIIILFAIEYLIRVIGARHRWKFVFSPLGIIDLIAILPFYISIGTIDLRALRIFRLTRLLSSLNIITLKYLREAFYDIRAELLTFLVMTLFVIYLASMGIYHFENPTQPEKFTSIFHCFWWAIVTLTTVGYGDMYPITDGGKIFTVFILFIGLGVVSVPSALLASSLVKRSQERNKQKKN